MAFTYILECVDGSYYVGSTNNLEKRIKQHQSGHGCVYTKLHLPVKLVFKEEYDTYQQAFSRERQIHGWSRAKKEALIKGNIQLLKQLSKSSPLHSSTNEVPELAEGKNQYGQYLLKVIDELKETGKPNLD